MSSTFDIRYVVILVINIIKSQTSMPWDWDPFDLNGHFTWTKFWILSTLFLIFSFTSIRIPLTCPLHIWHVQVHLGEFSITLVVLFVTSLLFPQSLFWYVYPIITLHSLCFAWVSNLFGSFVHWARDNLSTVPSLNLFISSIETDAADLEQELVGLGDGGAQV
ncbi:hypothetical protein Acr_14g0004880 [Actinidia rufa]|uniref:Uncharacterized protein n=1 Tax=Actinidia rufa TaxID=165716 RepID=A0A7J0FQ49_9ERIC|nr:hypothetical protein Acr_14g0004880 [Actinidia rufa]